MKRNPSLLNKHPDPPAGGQHIDVLRAKTSSAVDYDWKGTTGKVFRKRGHKGVFDLEADGLEKQQGSK